MTDSTPQILIRNSREEDIEPMLAIYRHHIRVGVEPSAYREDETLQADDLKRRRKNLKNRRLPHIVAEVNGTVVGYAYVVPFRKRPAYRFVVKHSIYVHHEHLRAGIGRALLPALIDACASAGFRQMIGYIDGANEASLKLHNTFGFREVGRLPAIGYKFGKWTDTVMVQRSLGEGSTTAPQV